MGEVDDVEHAEDEGEADREEEKEDAAGQAVQGLAEEVRDEGHRKVRQGRRGPRAPPPTLRQAGSVQPVPGSRTSTTLAMGTLLRPSAVSSTLRM